MAIARFMERLAATLMTNGIGDTQHEDTQPHNCADAEDSPTQGLGLKLQKQE